MCDGAAANAPRKVLPRHVKACHHSSERKERWFIWTWKRDAPQLQKRVPYCCSSWRCDECRRHEAAVTFARIKQATSNPELDPRGWCMLVLTLDREGYYSGQKRWHNTDAAYAELGNLSRKALDRIGRVWGADTRLEASGRSKKLRTVNKLGNRWVEVVEAHRSGWPHMNVLVWCPELADYLRREHDERLLDPEVANALDVARDAWRNKEPLDPRVRELARKATTIGGELRELLEAAGWGRESTAEAARDVDAVTGYVVKLAGLHETSVGELAKFTQAPLNAKERFRRLRSGKGFLPPRIKNPEVTGCLVRRRRAGYRPNAEWRGYSEDWEVYACNAPHDPAQAEPIERARAAELALIDEEEQLKSRAKRRGQVPPMPPVRVAVEGKLEHHVVTSAERWARSLRSRTREPA